MSQDTSLASLVINKMTKAQYDALTSKNANELYFVTDNSGLIAGSGLTLNGYTMNHSNTVVAATAGTSSATSGSTLAVPYIVYDAQGHITGSGTHTHTITGFTTTSDVNGLISSAIGGINSFNVEVVTTLPTTDIDEHTIYFISNSGSGTDVYDEYMYINNTWEKIGNTQVDLSGYVPTSRKINNKALTADITLTASDVGALPSSTTIPAASTTIPAMDGTASAGTETSWAKGDHVHPTDTSRQAAITATGILKGDGSGNITAAVAGTDYITGMYIASYGKSTYAEVLAAYQANKIIYCRASSNSNPATGNQLRMAFLAYVNNEATPTTFEFQYYRSVETHSASQQGDQVYIYKINSAGTWSASIREAYTKVVAGTNMSSSYSSGTITLAANDVSIVYTTTLAVASWSDTTPSTYTYSNAALKCGRLGTTPPLILCTSNASEYSNITSALATAGTGIVFTTDIIPESAIDITIVDFQ